MDVVCPGIFFGVRVAVLAFFLGIYVWVRVDSLGVTVCNCAFAHALFGN